MPFKNNKMRVLSCDPGVRNCAICILDVERIPSDRPPRADKPDKPRLDTVAHIPTWQVINMIGGDACCDFDKCTAQAKWEYDEEVAATPADAPSTSTDAPTTVTRTVCGKHKRQARIASNVEVRPLATVKVADVNTADLRLSIWSCFDALPELLQVDEVIIENQPSLKNPKMKAVAEAIFNFFLVRGILDRERTGSTIQEVRYVAANTKVQLPLPQTRSPLLTAADEQQAAPGAPEGGSQPAAVDTPSKKYRRCKLKGIKLANEYLWNCSNYLQALNSHRKKDDMCDSLLLALAYLQRVHRLPVSVVE
jgi:hypothetical protein